MKPKTAKAKRVSKAVSQAVRTQAVAAQLTINPEDFTPSQWVEMFWADDILTEEKHRKAKPIKVTRKEALHLAAACRSKASDVVNGVLGAEGREGENAEWMETLIDAAEILEGYAGIKTPGAGTADLLARRLKQAFPWIGSDEDVSGADVIDQLNALWQGLTEEAGNLVSCPKCGSQVLKSLAFVDEGEGAERGRKFFYCSEKCRETH